MAQIQPGASSPGQDRARSVVDASQMMLMNSHQQLGTRKWHSLACNQFVQLSADRSVHEVCYSFLGGQNSRMLCTLASTQMTALLSAACIVNKRPLKIDPLEQHKGLF